MDYTHHLELAKIEDIDRREELTAKADEERLTVAAVAELVSKEVGGTKKKPKKTTPKNATPLGLISKAQSQTRKLTNKLSKELLPLRKVASKIQALPEESGKKKKDKDSDKNDAKDKVEEMKQVLVELRNEAQDTLKALEENQSPKGVDLFRGLRELIRRQVSELQVRIPPINAEVKRMGDLDQVSDEEFNTVIKMFRKAAKEASKMKAVCETIMKVCHDLESE